MRTTLIALGVFMAACAAGNPKWKNLHVLPRSIVRDDLIATMRGWSKSLGVDCQHCHREIPPAKPGERAHIDFVSDAVPAKNITREMLLMTRRVNADTGRLVPKGGTVTCYTCHRGKTEPES